jgi:hypothetical protein
MSTRNFLERRKKEGRRVKLATSSPSVSLLLRQCGILNISQPYGAALPVMGIVYFYLEYFSNQWKANNIGGNVK